MTLSERERLLKPAPAPPGTTLYSEADHSKDIKTTDEHKLSYNKVGLSARRFWILVGLTACVLI